MIQYAGDRPKKVQVADHLRSRIVAGELAPGQSLGDINDVADSYGVSFGTVRAAYEILVREGWLMPIRIGMPTRVAEELPTGAIDDVPLGKLRNLHRELGEVITEFERRGAPRVHDSKKASSSK